MNRRTLPSILVVIVLPLFATGCVNGFEKYYRPSPNAQQVLKSPYVLPPPPTPTVYVYSATPSADNHKLQQDGYVYLGEASFYMNANKVSESQAVEQGKKVGAAVILIHSEYKDTVSGAVPYTVQNAPIVSTVNTSGTVNVNGAGGYATGTYNSSGTVMTPGGSSTYMIPYSFDRNSFDATFWAKRDTAKIIFGINVRPLPDEMKRHLERNTGVIVESVIRGTPAFQANVLEGDVLLKIGNDDVIDDTSLVAIVPKNAGRTVNLQILRNGQPKVISVAMRPNLSPP